MINEQLVTIGLELIASGHRSRLIHEVLKGLHIPPCHPDYDDLFQEGCLIFAQVYATYPGDRTDEAALMKYAYQKIRWRLIDYLRHNHFLDEYCECSLNDEALTPTKQEEVWCDPHSVADFSSVECRAALQTLSAQCSLGARKYLTAVRQLGLTTDTEIAAYYGVSRQAVHQWKNALVKVARRLWQL